MNAAPEKRPSLISRLLAGVFAAPGNFLGLARRKPLLTIGGSLLALILIGTSIFGAMWTIGSREIAVSHATLEQALTALEEGRLDEARILAVELRTANSLSPDERGGPAFVLGVAMSLNAQSAPNPDEIRNLYEIASRYLQEAADIGFPHGFEAEGAYRFGESLFQTDRFAEAIPRLKTAVKLKHPETTACHRMLATAYFLDSEPDLKSALVHNKALLAEKNLTDEDLEGALLQQAEIAFRLEDDLLLNEALTRATENAPSKAITVVSKVLRARSIIRDAERQSQIGAASALRQQAKELLVSVVEDAKSPREYQAEACFFLGKVESAESRFDSAITFFSRARRLAGGSALVAAITLEEGDVYLSRSDSDPDRAASAVASFRRVLKPLDPNVPFVNPWITRNEINSRVIAAVEKMLAARDYASAMDLNAALANATDSVDSLRLTGQIEMAWGHALQGELRSTVDTDQAKLKLAREHLRKAARAHQALADRKLASREFAPLMQQAAKLYEEGQDYESARIALTRTLDVQGRSERPETLVMLGKVLIDLDRLDAAIGAFNECYLSFRKNPVSYRARMLASQALIEQGKLEEARKLLFANLWEEDLSPESTDWRDSLFALAELLYTQARVAYAFAKEKAVAPNAVKADVADAYEAAAKLFDEASQRLNEAVARYPETEQAVLARYQLAECNRCLARNKFRLRNAHPIQTAQKQLETEAKSFLASALADLEMVQTQLNQRADTRELSQTERKLLRNCYFLSADCLFDLQRYDDAIQAYADAAGRYQAEPAAIEAFAQIAACYRKLKRPSDEHTAIVQAQAMLGRLSENADFSATTRASRGDWNDYLTWRASVR